MPFNNFKKRRNTQKPMAPAPKVIPGYCSCMEGTGSSMIQNQLNYYTYVWTNNGNSFWMFPVDYGSGVVSGYIWNGYGWEFASLYTDSIDCIF